MDHRIKPRGRGCGGFRRRWQDDLAVANESSNTISILLGNGDGTFRNGEVLNTGNHPSALAVADFNNDGNLDLVEGNAADGTLIVYLGDGTGNFSSLRPFMSVDPVSMETADFNHDGFVDLGVANKMINTISVYLGKGDGTFFQQSTPALVLKGPVFVAAADFTGDGNPDIAIANNPVNTVIVVAGKGDGTFKTIGAATLSTAAGPVWIATGDFNADGKLDLAVACQGANAVDVFLSAGSGNFQPGVAYATGSGPTSLAIGDFNGDSILDIAAASSIGQ